MSISNDRNEFFISQEVTFDDHVFKRLLLLLIRDKDMACSEGKKSTHLDLRK